MPPGCASARFDGKKGPATIADNATAFGGLCARLAGSRKASGSTGWEGRAYVMRVDNSARVKYASATLAVRKDSGVCQHPAIIAFNAKALCNLCARLTCLRDAHKATVRTPVRRCVYP
jgi:hypothetical protein